MRQLGANLDELSFFYSGKWALISHWLFPIIFLKWRIYLAHVGSYWNPIRLERFHMYGSATARMGTVSLS